MIINHKKLNQTHKFFFEIVLHAMHCAPPPPTHREILKKGQVCPYALDGVWCFLDLMWIFYWALLPLYIKK